MKKTFILLAAALLAGCGEESHTESFVPQTLSISSDTLDADADGKFASAEVTVTSSAEWSLTGEETWCHPSVRHGSSGTSVTFTVDPNESEKFRKEHFYFICGDAVRKLTITQAPPSGVELLSGTSFTVGSAGGAAVVRLYSCFPATETVDIPAGVSEWLSLSTDPVPDSGEQWITFQLKPNETFIDRNATVRLFKDSENEIEVEIFQHKYVGMRMDTESSFKFGVAGGTATVRIRSNEEVQVSGNPWIGVEEESSTTDEHGVTSKSYRITCPESQYSRVGDITFKPAAGASMTVKITQLNPDAETFTIPDQLFANALVSMGYVVTIDGHPEYSFTETGANLTSLYIDGGWYYGSSWTSVEGIEHFKHLTSLSIETTNVKRWDLSKLTELTSLSIKYTTLEELILGDLDIKSVRLTNMYISRIYDNLPKSFTISSSKVESLLLYGSSSTYDKMEWVDITGCPNLKSLTADRAARLCKTVYVTQAQKDAYDAGTLKIENYYNAMDIVVK